MLKRIKEYFKRIATKIVVYYCGRLYDKARNAADERHEKEGETIYVINNFIKGQTLSVINRSEFRWIKRKAWKLKDPVYRTASYGTEMLRRQAWYHTADRSGKNGLSDKEIKIRRLAFIRSGLRSAKLA